MNTQGWDLLKTVLIALISSGSMTALIKRYLDKHSKMKDFEEQLADIIKVTNRQGDAIQELLHSNMELLNILHEKKVINGESQHLRDGFAEYMYTSQAKGFRVKDKKKA